MQLTNNELITGGSSGIGAGIVQRCLADGYSVIVLDRIAPANASLVEFIEADLSDAQSTRRALDLAATSRRITRVVNNVGTALPASIEDSNLDQLSRMVDLNVSCTVEVMKALIGGMKEARFGRVVNISSRSALGRPNLSLYAATKAAVNGLTRSWGLELAAHGITVNGVGPGVINTELLAKTFPLGTDKRVDLENSIPMRRVGEAADIASAVSFFLREEAHYVTGQILYVCGGTSIMAAI
jgi:3-oxoacyl-[acyl-carrier protein] reductase